MGIYPWNKFWYFTCEISVYPAGTTFTQLLVWWLRPLLCYGEYTYDCNWKKSTKCYWWLWHITNMTSLTSWRLPVWNVNIRCYLASCTLQFWSNITKTSFQGKHLLFLCIVVNMTCRISHFQDGRSFQLYPLVPLLVDSYAWNEIYKLKNNI
jgi:hypothetical protein